MSIVKEFAAAFFALDHGDTSPMEALLADDVVMSTPQGTLSGRAAVAEKFRSSLGAFSNICHEVDFENGVVEADGAFIVEFFVSGDHTGTLTAAASAGVPGMSVDIPPTGRSFRVRTTDHLWHRDGKIYRFNIYGEPAERLRQLGIDVRDYEPAGSSAG